MAKIFFCGDIINQFSATQFISREIRDIITGCDYSVCNLEGVLAHENETYSSMKQHNTTISSLREAGFNLALLANNHITDYGKKELLYTIDCLKKEGLEYIGAGIGYEECYRIHYFTVKDLRFAVINIGESQGGQYDFQYKEYGHAWMGAPCISSLIKEAKLKADRLILCIHAGLEHYQLPLEQFRDIYRYYCDLGVDVVIGSHPHIVQGVEEYKGSLIFYSLGNFYFPRKKYDDYMTDKENQAFSVILSISSSDISYDIVYHRIENQLVCLTSKTPFVDIDKLSTMLGDPYYSLLEKQLLEAFYRLPMNLLHISLNGVSYDDNWFQKIKTMIRYFSKNKEQRKENEYKMNLLNHVVNNETYRYLVSSVINKRIYK